MTPVHFDISKSGIWLNGFIWPIHSYNCSNWSLRYPLLVDHPNLWSMKIFIWGCSQALGEAVVSLPLLRSSWVVI